MADIHVDLLGSCPANNTCLQSCSTFTSSLGGRLIGLDSAPTEQAAWLDLTLFKTMGDYLKACRQVSKGGIHADMRLAREAGYTFSEFSKQNYIEDIHEIHTSSPERQGKPMRDAYLIPVEEMGGAPKGWNPLPYNPCDEHWVRFYGAFESAPGRKLGGVEVGYRLRAYIAMKRIGSLGIYSMIIGHGDHLRSGVMGGLHGWIISRAKDPDIWTEFRGLDGVMYAGYFQGQQGLIHWKRKALFGAVDLYTP